MGTTTAPSAFTLVEMLLSLALGLIVCVSLFTTMRVAVACISTADRLALDNRIARTAVVGALNRIDFWEGEDSLIDPAARPLRDPAIPGANPFRPMTVSVDFDLAKPRSWWCGQPPVGNNIPNASWTTPPHWAFGDYSLMGCVGMVDGDASRAARRQWHHQTVRTLVETVGYYGALDYLPPGGICQYVGSDRRIPDEFLALHTPSGGAPWRFSPWSAGSTRDIATVTHLAAYAITTNPAHLAAGANRKPYNDHSFGGWAESGDMWRSKRMHDECSERRDLLPVRPTDWPEVEVDVRRYLYLSRWVTLAFVKQHNPVTGEVRRLRFMAPGTTLRGARQQRGLDSHLPGPP